MAIEQNGLIRGKDLGTGFQIDEAAKKINVQFPANTGLTGATLQGSNLVLTRVSGGNITVPLAGLIPAAKADKFLKNVTYDNSAKQLVFTIGNDLNGAVETVRTNIGDLVPVATGNGLQGNGTTASPVSVKTKAGGGVTASAEGLELDAATVAAKAKEGGFKPVATVELKDPWGATIGYAFTANQRVAA